MRHRLQSYTLTYFRLRKREPFIGLGFQFHQGAWAPTKGAFNFLHRSAVPQGGRGGDRSDHPDLAGGGGPKLLSGLCQSSGTFYYPIPAGLID